MINYLLLLLLVVAAMAVAAEQQQIALPGCLGRCGNISIPYLFGMDKPGCFLKYFEVICDTSFHPPRAFLPFHAGLGSYHQTASDAFYSPSIPPTEPNTVRGPIEIMDISIADNVVRAYGAVRSDCSTNGFDHSLKLQSTWLQNPFVLSPTHNVLIGVGRRVQPKLVNSFSIPGTSIKAWENIISCLSDTGNLKYVVDGPCPGPGCCKTDLPGDNLLTMFNVAFELENNTMNQTNPCSYGMVVDRSWYNFSNEDIYGYEVLSNKFPRGVPFVIDFTMRTVGGYCPSKEDLPPNYACISGNSSCTNSSLEGYVCNCLDHYEGNPYIANGCQDIDECQQPALYPCSSDGSCQNRLEGYDCPCRSGMKGDGIKGTCRGNVQKFPLAAKVIVGLAALIIVFLLMIMARQQLKLKRFYEQNGGQVLKGVKNIRIYTRKQLKEITSNYKRVIGEGHFGKVYIGALKDKQLVAIKKSIKVDKETKKEFTDEVIIQSEMRHKNIARLLGCCLELDVPLLVYEFVARGSLYDVLFGCRDSIPVDTRLGIAIGSAEGLTYMHSAGESTIRHGDVKSANILLDENFTPKVSDFGTSRLLDRGKAEKTDLVIGDKSYIDPVYMEQGILTQKSDVYSFGIVLIELITRRAATHDGKRSYVANFVQACLDERSRDFVDNDITSEVDIKILEMVSRVAVECLKANPEERLDMKQVEHRLLQINGGYGQHGQERNYQGNQSPIPDDVALLKSWKTAATAD
uniref:Uncharacterized protein n=1 Tax=Avena sativa TaxID=4498 RepID=A0ACD5VAL0_AVESA